MKEFKIKLEKDSSGFGRREMKIFGETLRQAVEERKEFLFRTIKPDCEQLVKIEKIDFEYSKSIFGGKGGVKAIFTAMVSTSYVKGTPKYQEYTVQHELWIYASEEDIK